MIKLNKKGFTLVELLAVIAVTSLVLGLSTYGIINAYKKSKDKTIVLNEKGILEAARISSAEEGDTKPDGTPIWKVRNESEYYCTTIQRLKNRGLLKKNASSEKEAFVIVVERNITTKNVIDARFDNSLKDLCGIDFYKIHYEANTTNVTNMPSDHFGETCPDNTETCSVLETYISNITPKKRGYTFVNWNTNADGTGTSYSKGQQIINKPQANSTLTLYAQWRQNNDVIFNLKACEGEACDGVKITPSTTLNGNVNNWSIDNSTKNIKKNNQVNFFKIAYETSDNLPNYNNESYINLYYDNSNSSKSYSVPSKNEWRCISDNCKDTTFDQSIAYSSSNFCDASNDDCIVTLVVNWQDSTLLSPNVEANDHIPSDNWHNTKELYLIVSSDSNADYYEYKVCNGSVNKDECNTNYTRIDQDSNGKYIIPVPDEGTYTYFVRTSFNGSSSSDTKYILKYDKTAPNIDFHMFNDHTNLEYTTNSDDISDINWFSLVPTLKYDVTDSGSGVSNTATIKWNNSDNYNQLKTDIDGDGETCDSSASNCRLSIDSNNDIYSFTRNINSGGYRYIIFRVKDKAGNESTKEIYFKFDNSKPKIQFSMQNGTTSISYSLNPSVAPSWFNLVPTLTYKVTDLGSGISNNATFSWNAEENYNNLETSISGSSTITSSDTINNGYIFTRVITSGGYRYIKFTISDKAGNITEQNVYFKYDDKAPTINSIVNPTGGNWTKNNFALTIHASDSGSGIKYYQYHYNNRDWVTYSNSNKNDFTTTKFTDERNEPVYIRACDYAGNCSQAKSTNIKIDKTAPNVTVELLNKNNSLTPVSSDFYRSSYDSSLNWFTRNNLVPVIRWTASDNGSGVNPSAKYYSNNDGGQTLDANHTEYINEYSLNGTLNSNKYTFTVGNTDNIPGGYRKYKLYVCDKADNCKNNPIYFKYNAHSVETRCVKVKSTSYLNCRKSPKSFASSVTTFNCPKQLYVYKTYVDNWYYYQGNNCYLDAQYLAKCTPTCSSGGTGNNTGNDNSNCTYCVRLNDCPALDTGDGFVTCDNNVCMIKNEDTGRYIGCV